MYKYVCGVLQAFIRQYPVCKLEFHTSTSPSSSSQTGKSPKNSGIIKLNKTKNLKHKQLTSSKRKKAFFLYKIIWEKLVNPLLELVTPGLKTANQLSNLSDFRTHGGWVSKIEDSIKSEKEVCSKCLEEPTPINLKKRLEIDDCIIKDPLKIVKSYNARPKESRKTMEGNSKGKHGYRKLKNTDKDANSPIFYNVFLRSIVENKVEKMMPNINDEQVSHLWDFRVQQDSMNIVHEDQGLENSKILEKGAEQSKLQEDLNSTVLPSASDLNRNTTTLTESTIQNPKPLSSFDSKINDFEVKEAENIPKICPGPIFMTLHLNDFSGNVNKVKSGKDTDTIKEKVKTKKSDGKKTPRYNIKNVKIPSKAILPQQRVANSPNLKEDVIKKLLKIANSTPDQKIKDLQVNIKPVHTKRKSIHDKLNLEVGNNTGKIQVTKSAKNDLKLMKGKVLESKKDNGINTNIHENFNIPELPEQHDKSQAENIDSEGEKDKIFAKKDVDTRNQQNSNSTEFKIEGENNIVMNISENSTEINVKLNDKKSISNTEKKLNNDTVFSSNVKDNKPQTEPLALETKAKENNQNTIDSEEHEHLNEEIKSTASKSKDDTNTQSQKEKEKNISSSQSKSGPKIEDSSVFPTEATNGHQSNKPVGLENDLKIKRPREDNHESNKELEKNTKKEYSAKTSSEEPSKVGIKTHFVSFRTEDDEGFILKQEQSLNGGIGDLIDINSVIENENKALRAETSSENTKSSTKSFRKQGSLYKATDSRNQFEKTLAKPWKKGREQFVKNEQILKLKDITNVVESSSSNTLFLKNDTKDKTTKDFSDSSAVDRTEPKILPKHDYKKSIANSAAEYSNKSITNSSAKDNTKENMPKKSGSLPVEEKRQKTQEDSGDLKRNASKTLDTNDKSTRLFDSDSGSKNIYKTSHLGNAKENVTKNALDVQSVDRKLSQSLKINNAKQNFVNSSSDLPYDNRNIANTSSIPTNTILNAIKKVTEEKESSDRVRHKSKQVREINFYAKNKNLKQSSVNNITSSYVRENILNPHESSRGKNNEQDSQNNKLNSDKTQKNEEEINCKFTKDLKLEAQKNLKKNDVLNNRQPIMKDKEGSENIIRSFNEKNVTNKMNMVSKSVESKVGYSRTKENKSVQTSESSTGIKTQNTLSHKQDKGFKSEVKTDILKSHNKESPNIRNIVSNHSNEMLKYRSEGSDISTKNNILVKKTETLKNSTTDSKPLKRNISTKQSKESQVFENISSSKNKSEEKIQNKAITSSNFKRNLDVKDRDKSKTLHTKSNTTIPANNLNNEIIKKTDTRCPDKNNNQLNNDTCNINSNKHSDDIKFSKNIKNDNFKQKVELRKEFKVKMNQLLKSLSITGHTHETGHRFAKSKIKGTSNQMENLLKKTEIILTRSSSNVSKENTIKLVTQHNTVLEPMRKTAQQENIIKGTKAQSLAQKLPSDKNLKGDVLVNNNKLQNKSITSSNENKNSLKLSGDKIMKNIVETNAVKLAESNVAARLRKVAKIIPFSKVKEPKLSSQNPKESNITVNISSQNKKKNR